VGIRPLLPPRHHRSVRARTRPTSRPDWCRFGRDPDCRCTERGHAIGHSSHATVTIAELSALRAKLPEMIEHLAALVECESPSNDIDACRRCASILGDLGTSVLGQSPSTLVEGERPFLRWSFGET